MIHPVYAEYILIKNRFTFAVVSLSSSILQALSICLSFFKFSFKISSLLLKFFFASITVNFFVVSNTPTFSKNLYRQLGKNPKNIILPLRPFRVIFFVIF